MKQIRYGSSAVPLRLEYPEEWDAKLVSGVTLTVYDTAGTALMAADAATLYTATTLDGAVSQFAKEIVLDDQATALSIGDPILISGASGDEVRRVEAYTSSTFTAVLERILDNEYDDGDDVYGMFADYSLDISTTTTFTNGIVLTLVWTPTGSGNSVSEMVQVASQSVDLSGLRGIVSDIYPRAYDVFTTPVDRFARIAAAAERQVGRDLRVNNMDIQRIKDQDEILDAVAAKIACLWVLSADQDKEDERKALNQEYEAQLAVIKSLPVWTDSDLDNIEDEEEITSHEWRPGRGF